MSYPFEVNRVKGFKDSEIDKITCKPFVNQSGGQSLGLTKVRRGKGTRVNIEIWDAWEGIFYWG